MGKTLWKHRGLRFASKSKGSILIDEPFDLNNAEDGEVDKEKGPVDVFPTEPTDEAIYGEETLNLGFKGLIGI